MTITLILFYIFFPAVILYFSNKYKLVNKIGAVLIAYLVGMILGNSGLLPEGSEGIQEMVATITVPLSLPLLLFSMQISKIKSLAGKALLSMFLSIVSLIVIVYAGFVLFGDKIPEAYKTAGLLMGVYTGGTPNLASIKTALDISSETYILTITYDTIISMFFIFFFITIGKKVYEKFLPKFNFRQVSNTVNGEVQVEEDISSFKGMFTKERRWPLLGAIGLAIVILAIGAGLSEIVPKDKSMLTAILSITTLALGASMIKKVNKIEKTFQAGMYLILIFSLDVASMAKFDTIDISSLYLFFYVAFAIMGTMIIHLTLSYFFKIDADTTIITCTAMVCSPPFVPVVAGALKNKDVILPGLTVGILGYAVGNYLGVSLALLLQ